MLAFNATRVGDWLFASGGSLLSEDAITVAGFALTVTAVLLPLPFGLGWRSSVLLAAVCYPLVLLAPVVTDPLGAPFDQLKRAVRPLPAVVGHTDMLAALFLPPLLVLCWAVAQAVRAGRGRRGEAA